MVAARGLAVSNPKSRFEPFIFSRRDPGEHDIRIDITFCGVCHSDIHQVRDEWGGAVYPMVPGHEIIGKVGAVGSKVQRFKVGDTAGVGCFVDSCRTCTPCQERTEQFCESGAAMTYNSYEMDKKTPTYGGYSNVIVVHETYAMRVSPKIAEPAAAPLLCAGITTYSPLRQWKVGRGHQVAVLGLGGLGHMAVKLAAAFGAEVTVLSTSKAKEADAKRLGAQNFCVTTNKDAEKKLANRFHFIVNTVSAPHDLNLYLNFLRTEGTMVLLGVPPVPSQFNTFLLVGRRRRLVGSLIGGTQETQEMLDFCAEHQVGADVEVIKPTEIATAYERMLKNDVRYRFAIDMQGM